MSLIAGSYERFVFGFAVPVGLEEAVSAPAPLRRTFTEGAHRGAVRSLAASGRMVASGGPEDLVRLMDAHTGADLGLLACPGRGAVSALAFAAPPQGPEPCELLAGSADGTVCVWRRADGWQRPESLRLSAQSKAWEAREEAKAMLGVEGGEEGGEAEGGKARGGAGAGSGGPSRREKKRERAARFREARRQEEQARDEEEEGGELEDPASYTDPAEAEAAAARLGWRARRRGATAYAASTSTTEERLAAHASGSAARDVETIAAHPSGAAALSASRDGWLRTWDLSRRRELAGARLPLPARAVAFCDDVEDAHGAGRYAVAAGRIVEVHGCEGGAEGPGEEASGAPLPGAPRELVHPGFKAPIALAWASRRFLVSGDEGGTLRLWDLERPRGEELAAEVRGHAMRVRAAVAEPRPLERALFAAGKGDERARSGAGPRLVATAGTDGMVKVWRVVPERGDEEGQGGSSGDAGAKEEGRGGSSGDAGAKEEGRGASRSEGGGAKEGGAGAPRAGAHSLRLVAQGSTGGARLTCLAWAPRLEEAEAAGKITKRLRKRAAAAEEEAEKGAKGSGKGTAKQGARADETTPRRRGLKGSSISVEVAGNKIPTGQVRSGATAGPAPKGATAGPAPKGATALPTRKGATAGSTEKGAAPSSSALGKRGASAAPPSPLASAAPASVPGTVSFMTEADERKLQRQRKKAKFDADRASKKLKSLRKKKKAPAFE